MNAWICPSCGIYFTTPDKFLDRAAECPECGGEASSVEGELDCAQAAQSPVGSLAQIVAGLVAGTLLGGAFVGVECLLLWGLRASSETAWVYYPLQAGHVLLIASWLFLNGQVLARGKDRPLSVRITLVLALLCTTAVYPLWRVFS